MEKMLINRRKEPLTCKPCSSDFDYKERTPRVNIPCGHTICAKCVTSCTTNKCVQCNEPFNQTIPDYEMVDMMKNAPKPKLKLLKRSDIKEKMIKFMKTDS